LVGTVDGAELRRTLQSLACGKKKVLRKVPPGRDVGDGDVFRFNADFEDPRAKVHINSIQAKVSVSSSFCLTCVIVTFCLLPSYDSPRSRSAQINPLKGTGNTT